MVKITKRIILDMEEQGQGNQNQPEQSDGQQQIVNEDPVEAASRSTANYANYEPPSKARNPIWTKIIAIVAVLIVLTGLAGGGYIFLKHHKSSKKTSTTVQTALPPAASQITSTTKHYDSSTFQLGFDYPKDWVVADTSGNFMTVTSPKLQLKSADGQSVKGQVVLSILNKIQKLPEFDSGNATAVKASVKIAYTKPSPSQRGSTYESFLRFANTAAGLSGIYITGDSGYTLAQAIPKVDVQKVEPIISLRFYKCADAACSGTSTDLAIAVTSWDDKTFSGPLDSMLESLAIN